MKLNGNGKPAPKGTDEAIYNDVERLSIIAQIAGDMVKLFKDTALPGEKPSETLKADTSAKLAEMMLLIEQEAKDLNHLETMSRLVVLLAAVGKNKNLLGATLTASKADKLIHMKCFYAGGENDFYNMAISPEVATQLSEGLMKGVEMLKPKIILPSVQLIGNA